MLTEYHFPVPATAPMVATPVPTTTTINVTWNELACQDHHGVITHYEVHYNTSDFNEDRSLTLNTAMGDDTSLLIEDLEEFGNYTIEVRAHTAAGAGPYSSPMNVQSLPNGKSRNLYIHVMILCISYIQMLHNII